MPPRLHVAAPFAEDATLVLPAAAARHVQVLRLQPGSAMTLFNGDDGADWSATVTRMTRSEVEVRLGAPRPVDRELPFAVTLAIGAPANDRMDAFVEKACELGAAAIQPLLCERSVLRLAGERAEAKRRHWAGIAASASEQCGRSRVTRVMAMQPFPAWLDGERGRIAAHRVVLSFDAAAEAAAPPAVAAAPSAPVQPTLPEIVVLSGPEGGLSDDEERAAVACGFARTRLGPRVLRADTAPLAWLAWLAIETAGQPS
ncbi:MAG: 16S rRNA (uracil(1498)-N(3))-methyltransferase [Caldimonas sp.]